MLEEVNEILKLKTKENSELLKGKDLTYQELQVLIVELMKMKMAYDKEKNKITNPNKKMEEDIEEGVEYKEPLPKIPEKSGFEFSNDSIRTDLNISQNKCILKLGKKKNKITYITICSSAASSGKATIIEESAINNTAGTKAALFGVEEDVQKVDKLFKNLGSNGFLCQGNYTFTCESVSSIGKETFLSSLQSFFDNGSTDGCLIYYSGHGFPDASILFESSQGNYFMFYEDIIKCWKNRANPDRNTNLLIILDCCYSGSWVKKLLENGDFNDVCIQGSSTEEEKSLDMGSGKGSLFTNAFLWSNLFGKKFLNDTPPVKCDFDFSTIEAKKFQEQKPRGFCFEDSVEKLFRVKTLNHNSWEEIYSYDRSRWKKWKWEYLDNIDPEEKLYSEVNIKTLDKERIKLSQLYDFNPHLVFSINEEVLTCQGEILTIENLDKKVNQKNNTNNNTNNTNNTNKKEEKEETNYKEEEEKREKISNQNNIYIKKLIRMQIRNKNIQKNWTGYLSLYKKTDSNDFTARYFNKSSKKKSLVFERSLEETQKIMRLFQEIIFKLEKGEYTSNSALEENCLEILKVITIMDKTCLLLDEEDNMDDDDDEEEVDYFDQINKLSLAKSELKDLKIGCTLTPKLMDILYYYLVCPESNIWFVDLKLDDEIDCIYSLLDIPLIEKVNLKLGENCSLRLLESLELLNTKRKISITFPKQFNKLQGFSILSIEKLLLSDSLTKIEFIGFIPKYEYLLPKFSEIKSLKCFILKDYQFSSINHIEFKDSNEKGVIADSIFQKLLKNFKSHTELKAFSIVNCNISEINSLNENLELLDFSNNQISHCELPMLLNTLSTLKYKYRINLSKNLLSKVTFKNIKSFLNGNDLCLEFNTSFNDISEESIIDLMKINIVQKNSIDSVDISGTNFIEEYSNLNNLIKSVKKIKFLNASDCDLTEKKLFEVSKAFNQSSINNITILDLSYNKVKEESKMKLVLNALKNSKTLVDLRLNSVFDIRSDKIRMDYNLELFILSESLKQFSFNDNIMGPNKGFIIKQTPMTKDREFFTLKNLSIKGTNIKEISIPGFEFESLTLEENSLCQLKVKAVKNLIIYKNISEEKQTTLELNEKIIKNVEKLGYNPYLGTSENNNDNDNDYDMNKEELSEKEVNGLKEKIISEFLIKNKFIGEILEKADKEKKDDSRIGTFFTSDFHDYSLNNIHINSLIADDLDNTAYNDIEAFISKNSSKISNSFTKMHKTYDNIEPANDSLKDIVIEEEVHGRNLKLSYAHDYIIYNKLQSDSLAFYNYIRTYHSSKICLKNYLSTANPFEIVTVDVKFLILNFNYFDIEAFKECLDLSNIEYLELNSLHLKTFLKMLKEKVELLSNLRCLVIRDSEVNTNEIKTLNEIFNNENISKNLKELHLINTFIDAKESKLLMKGLYYLKNINTINLSENCLNSLFIKELSDYLLNYSEKSNEFISNIILRDCGIQKEVLLKLIRNLDNFTGKTIEKLDISGFRTNKTTKITKLKRNTNFKTELYNQEISYSNTKIEKYYSSDPVNTDTQLYKLTLDTVNIEEHRNELYKFFTTIPSIELLRLKKCQRENKCFYFLNKLLKSTKIQVLDFSGSLINKKNVNDVIEIINNQRRLDDNYLKKVLFKNCNIEDVSYLKLLECLVSNKIEGANFNRNKLTKNSLISLNEYCIKYSNSLLSCNKEYIEGRGFDKNRLESVRRSYNHQHAFISDVENNNNKKVYQYLFFSLKENSTKEYQNKEILEEKNNDLIKDLQYNNIYNLDFLTTKYKIIEYIVNRENREICSSIKCRISPEPKYFNYINNLGYYNANYDNFANYEETPEIYLNLNEVMREKEFIDEHTDLSVLKKDLFELQGQDNYTEKIVKVDEDKIITASLSGDKFRLWSVARKTCLASQYVLGNISDLVRVKDYLYLIGGGKLRLWNVKSLECEVLSKDENVFYKYIQMIDEEFFFSLINDYKILELWSLKEKKPIKQIKIKSFNQTKILKYNDYLIIPNNENNITLYSIRKNQEENNYDIEIDMDINLQSEEEDHLDRFEIIKEDLLITFQRNTINLIDLNTKKIIIKKQVFDEEIWAYGVLNENNIFLQENITLKTYFLDISNVLNYDMKKNKWIQEDQIIFVEKSSMLIMKVSVIKENIFATTQDDCFRIWSISDRKVIKTFPYDNISQNNTCLINLKNNIFIQGGNDNLIHVFTLDIEITQRTLKQLLTGEEEKENQDSNVISSIINTEKNKVIFSFGLTIQEWKLENYRLERQFKLKENNQDTKFLFSVNCLCYVNSEFFVGAYDNLLIVWCLKEKGREREDYVINKYEKILKGHSSYIISLIKVNNKNVASACNIGTVKVWDLKRWECIFALSNFGSFPLLLMLNDDIMAVSYTNQINNKDTSISFYSIEKKQLQQILVESRGLIKKILKISETYILTVADDETIFGFDITLKKRTLMIRQNYVVSGIERINADIFALGCNIGTSSLVSFWSIGSQICLLNIKYSINDSFLISLRMTSENKLVIGSDKSTARVIDLSSIYYIAENKEENNNNNNNNNKENEIPESYKEKILLKNKETDNPDCKRCGAKIKWILNSNKKYLNPCKISNAPSLIYYYQCDNCELRYSSSCEPMPLNKNLRKCGCGEFFLLKENILYYEIMGEINEQLKEKLFIDKREYTDENYYEHNEYLYKCSVCGKNYEGEDLKLNYHCRNCRLSMCKECYNTQAGTKDNPPYELPYEIPSEISIVKVNTSKNFVGGKDNCGVNFGIENIVESIDNEDLSSGICLESPAKVVFELDFEREFNEIKIGGLVLENNNWNSWNGKGAKIYASSSYKKRDLLLNFIKSECKEGTGGYGGGGYGNNTNKDCDDDDEDDDNDDDDSDKEEKEKNKKKGGNGKYSGSYGNKQPKKTGKWKEIGNIPVSFGKRVVSIKLDKTVKAKFIKIETKGKLGIGYFAVFNS